MHGEYRVHEEGGAFFNRKPKDVPDDAFETRFASQVALPLYGKIRRRFHSGPQATTSKECWRTTLFLLRNPKRVPSNSAYTPSSIFCY
jgi:hypothetical protein